MTTSGADPIRVMVVDDSAVVRGMIANYLGDDPEVAVVVTAGNGQIAVDSLRRTQADVVILDIEMPVMDGLTAIPKLLEIDSSIRILMSSTLTQRGADISIRAMQAGAADYIPKPTSLRSTGTENPFKVELVAKVKALGEGARRNRRRPVAAGDFARPLAPAPVRRAAEPPKVTLRPFPPVIRPEAIAIGSSTGGPQALFKVMAHLKGVTVPVFLTQHMPATFTALLAEHISRQCGVTCTESKDGEPVLGGRVYLAPGDWHMTVTGTGAGRRIALNQNPPENFCRPAVDPMLRSLAQSYGGHLAVAILTGMGQDGMRGAQSVVEAGGVVIAQDETTSVVWGMPGAAATAGVCSAVLPIDEVGPRLQAICQGGRDL